MKILTLLIPVFPLLGFVILGLGHRALPRRIATLIGTGTIFISFILVLIVAINFRYFSTSLFRYFTWLSISNFTVSFEFLIDPLSILMMLIVTGVGFIIHVYSVGYMKEDAGYNRFFAYMNLFVFSMLMLVMGSNYLILFIGWEGVGLCSYLLIGFWFRNGDYNNAAKKAFIMNRIGDLGFLLGIFLLVMTFKSLDFIPVFEQAKHYPAGSSVIVAITLLLFVGATGKSAQIPLYTWLPDAMAGPTPVSALIHAATMVTAGVYMIARSGVLYVLAPFTMSVVGITGLATALFAAIIALYQNDIKKILAYSTISQLGYMFLALSVGAFTGAMFHLTTHAFFKALLFLGAGSVIHALNGEQDIRKMGGLKSKLPVTYWTFLVGTLAIAGIPPFAGFFSKDEILADVFPYSYLLWMFAVAGALATAFYMFRLFYLAFHRTFRGTDDLTHHLHESHRVMLIPLIALAFLSLFGGFINFPALMGGDSSLEKYLKPVFADAKMLLPKAEITMRHSMEWNLIGFTLLLVIGAIWMAYDRYITKERVPAEPEVPLSFPERLIANKFWVDEIHDFLIVRPVIWMSKELHRIMELKIIDGVVNGTGNLISRASNIIRYMQTGHVGFYLFMMVFGIILLLIFNILIF